MNESINLEKLLLDDFGLSKNEATLYLSLLKHGPSTVLEASDFTGINRATVHMNVDYLLKKGLINQIGKGQGSRRTLLPEPPEKLETIIRAKVAKLQSIEEKLPRAIEALNLLKSESREKAHDMEVRHYKGKNEVRFIYEAALNAKEFRAYRNWKKLSTLFPMNVPKLLKIHMHQKEMQIWEILEDSKETVAYLDLMPKERFYVRLAPKNSNLCLVDIDYMMFDGNIAVVDLSKEINGIMISNKNLYKSTVAMFKFIWETLKP